MPVVRSVERSRGRGIAVNDRPSVIRLTIRIPAPAASSTNPMNRSQDSLSLGQDGPRTAHTTAATMTIN
jgi:hypothetical protein